MPLLPSLKHQTRLRYDEQVYFHNHIAHHDITIWALGANPATIRSQHDRNSLYQREAMVIQDSVVKDMADPAVYKRCLGREENFLNYCRFFEDEINRLGYQAVLQKYLVDGSEIADDMLCRIYMGSSPALEGNGNIGY